MIAKWTIDNFKSIKTETELELAPLTILAGANSSGKSTFIQSLLLVAQTLSDPIEKRAVVLNGSLVNLGQFKDLRSHGTDRNEITIKCTRNLDRRQRIVGLLSRLRSTQKNESLSLKRVEVAFEFAFDAGLPGKELDVFQIRPRLSMSMLTHRSIGDNNEENSRFIFMKNDSNSHYSNGNEKDWFAEWTGEEEPGYEEGGWSGGVDTDDQSLSEIEVESNSGILFKCNVEHFLPSKYFCEINPNREVAREIARIIFDKRARIGRFNILKNLDEDDDFYKFVSVFEVILPNFNGIEDEIGDYWLKNYSPEGTVQSSFVRWWKSLTKEQYLKIRQHCKNVENIEAAIYENFQKFPGFSARYMLIDLPDELEVSRLNLTDHFGSCFKYLGPLRETPKSLYPHTPSVSLGDIGVQGENTASTLETFSEKLIDYIPAKRFSTSTVDAQTESESLENAVNDWLQYVGIAKSVKSQYKGKFGHELQVYRSESGDKSDLTHVGVGISQVLPILVICLLAKRDSTIVIEQPELHLHPKVQSLLGDFFLSMALCGKQCIIETHSEYLVDRLRFRIAADPIEKSSFEDKVKIYFVEQNSEGSSQFQAVDVNEYGSILDWPDGFFDESQRQSEEILCAAFRKRQSKEEK